MLKSSKNIITAIELGTSKICVLIGNSNPNGQLEVIGHGEVPSSMAVIMFLDDFSMIQISC